MNSKSAGQLLTRADLLNFEQRINDQIDSSFHRYMDKILRAIDPLFGRMNKYDEEHEIIRKDHHRLVKIEERVELLEGQNNP